MQQNFNIKVILISTNSKSNKKLQDADIKNSQIPVHGSNYALRKYNKEF